MKFPDNITPKEMDVDHLDPSHPYWQNACKVAWMLQDIRDYYNKNGRKVQINVHVGYRSDEKNKSVGGSKTSQHLDGSAVDFSTYGTIPLHEVFNDIIMKRIPIRFPVSQIILEQSRINPKNWGWIHLAVWSEEWEEYRKSIGKMSRPDQNTICVNKTYILVNKEQPATPV